MYVSVAEYVTFASNNLGMYFSDDIVKILSYDNALKFQPQVIEKDVVANRSWFKISGSFKATSSAKYLIIGNFLDDSHTQVIKTGTGKIPAYDQRAYYFIDDISVELVAAPFISASDDQVICQGESATIHAEGNFETIEWTTLEDTTIILSTDKDFVVRPSAVTSYRAKGLLCKLAVVDTVTVHVIPFEQPDLGGDTIICAGSTLRVHPSVPYNKYTWSDNSSGAYLDISQSGKYAVTVESDAGCIGIDEISVSTKLGPDVELGSDTVICMDPLLLYAGEGIPTCLWSNGATSPSITVNEGGTYWVLVSNDCGQDRDTIQVYSHKDLLIPNVITLNGDGLNDRFQITGRDSPYPGSLRVFNRLGEILFSETEYKGDWPGEGNLPDTGVYYYSLDYGCTQYKGWIQIFK
jgi:gliding motility-associated-like protein